MSPNVKKPAPASRSGSIACQPQAQADLPPLRPMPFEVVAAAPRVFWRPAASRMVPFCWAVAFVASCCTTGAAANEALESISDAMAAVIIVFMVFSPFQWALKPFWRRKAGVTSHPTPRHDVAVIDGMRYRLGTYGKCRRSMAGPRVWLAAYKCKNARPAEAERPYYLRCTSQQTGAARHGATFPIWNMACLRCPPRFAVGEGSLRRCSRRMVKTSAPGWFLFSKR